MNQIEFFGSGQQTKGTLLHLLTERFFIVSVASLVLAFYTKPGICLAVNSLFVYRSRIVVGRQLDCRGTILSAERRSVRSMPAS
jgi:hypothetical protein